MAEDLSRLHQPVGGLLAEGHTAGDWSRYRLSDDQVEFFHANGYLAGVRILDDAQVERLRAELAGLFDANHDGRELWYEYHTNESTDPSRVLFHALGAWRVAPGFHDILWHPAFVVPASQLLGGAVRFWHDQLFCKPARHGGAVAWHQDYSYWTRTVPMQHLTCWIGLDDARSDNGCLHYVPGSHKWELLPVTGLAGDMDAVQDLLGEEYAKQFRPVAVELKAGEAAFHHPLMMHGSFANTTDRPRRAVVINAVKDGTRSDSDEPLLDGVPAVPRGRPLGGQFFPLLYTPAASA